MRWEDVRLELPPGWVVHEQESGRFAVTDAPLGTEDAPGAGEAGAFFLRDPGDSADKWRGLITSQGWVLEEDRAVTVDGLPATRLTFLQRDVDVPTRETVVLVPSRSLTILLQPIPLGRAQDGPDIYQRHLLEFEAILDAITFGAPEG